MEEKINNQKIFSYTPSIVAKMILDSELQDSDIFIEEEISEQNMGKKRKSTNNFINSQKVIVKPNMFPIVQRLQNTIVMDIKLKGFQKLISILSFKDPEDLKEKMFSEYLSIITPKILLKISNIIEKNGGEIVKYNDYEFTTIWSYSLTKDFTQIKQNKKFYAKYAILTAAEIMKYVDKTEIACGVQLKINIGIATGKAAIVFFGGERKRSEYAIMGESIERAENCLSHSLSHEIIISKELNNLFLESNEIKTKPLDNEDLNYLFRVTQYNESLLKDFSDFGDLKMKINKINMNKEVYDNLANKVYIYSSILPQGLLKYFDIGKEENLKEINVVTIATIQIFFKFKLEYYNNYSILQNLILDIQKATYLTFGSFLYVSKTHNGLLVRCIWGMDPGAFVDDTARAISTAIIIGKLTEHYKVQIGIGIATGSCYIGLIPIQGDRKQLVILGKKVNLSRILSDEALEKVVDRKKKYYIYCDKLTMQQSQKWYRHSYVAKMKIYLDQNSDLSYEIYDFLNIENNKKLQKKGDNYFIKESKDLNKSSTNYRNLSYSVCIEKKRQKKQISDRVGSCVVSKLATIKEIESTTSENNNTSVENKNDSHDLLITEIYIPIQREEYFVPKKYDPFPLIRTHLNNSFIPNNQYYVKNHLENYGEDKINLDSIYPKKQIKEIKKASTELSQKVKEKEKEINSDIDLIKNYQRSNTIFGNNKELETICKIMNEVIENNTRQFFLIKGPLGIGKSLFVRNALNHLLIDNEKLSNVYFNEEEFIFCNLINPLTNIIPYNSFSFIFRKIFLHLKRLNKIIDLYKIVQDLSIDILDIEKINFILSNGNNDINLINEFNKLDENANNILTENSEYSGVFVKDKKSNSVVAKLEGPHKFLEGGKVISFFYEMIIIYREYLNSNKNPFKIPLIFVLDDIQYSDHYSIDFIKFIFNENNEEKLNKLNPFIVILIEQMQFNINWPPLKHRMLEIFFSTNEENDTEINEDKILSFELQSFTEKEYINKILFANFLEKIFEKYHSNIESIDDKIINFLIMKSFNGIPLLFITLFGNIMISNKYTKKEGGNFLITENLIDDNNYFDWSDIILPYIYEKIGPMIINNILDFKEILLFKYACIIGTIFDIQTLDLINPLKMILETEDLKNIMLKLNDNYIIELYNGYHPKNIHLEKKIVYKICFPFLREVLLQKIPIAQRVDSHRKIAKFISTTTEKANYLSFENEVKIIKRHLIYSEINVTEEIEIKGQESVFDSIQNKKIIDYNNLKFLVVKELCCKLFYNHISNIFEGCLEVKMSFGWKKVKYYINRRCKILLHDAEIKNKNTIFGGDILISDISQNIIINRGPINNPSYLLEIDISEKSNIFKNTGRKKFYFRSKQFEDICKLDIALNFLRVKVNFDKFSYEYGLTKFPLYKKEWYNKKEKKYDLFIKENVELLNTNPILKSKKSYKSFSFLLFRGSNIIDKIMNASKKYKKSLFILLKTIPSIFLGYIQENLNFKNLFEYIDYDSSDEEESEGELNRRGSQPKKQENFYFYSFYFSTPKHIKNSLQAYFKELKQEEKEIEIEIPVLNFQRSSLAVPRTKTMNQFYLRQGSYKKTVEIKSSKEIKKLLLAKIIESENQNEEDKLSEEEELKTINYSKTISANVNLNGKNENKNENIVNNNMELNKKDTISSIIKNNEEIDNKNNEENVNKINNNNKNKPLNRYQTKIFTNKTKKKLLKDKSKTERGLLKFVPYNKKKDTDNEDKVRYSIRKLERKSKNSLKNEKDNTLLNQTDLYEDRNLITSNDETQKIHDNNKINNNLDENK